MVSSGQLWAFSVEEYSPPTLQHKNDLQKDLLSLNKNINLLNVFQYLHPLTNNEDLTG